MMIDLLSPLRLGIKMNRTIYTIIILILLSASVSNGSADGENSNLDEEPILGDNTPKFKELKNRDCRIGDKRFTVYYKNGTQHSFVGSADLYTRSARQMEMNFLNYLITIDSGRKARQDYRYIIYSKKCTKQLFLTLNFNDVLSISSTN